MELFSQTSESAIRFCKMQSDILREYVKEDDFITTNGMFANLDNHKMEDTCLDVYTYDSYPNFAYCMKENPKNNRTLNDRKWSKNLTEVRSVCPHFGIMEQQSGANGWNTHADAPAPKPGQMMLWAMQSIMHGADYISFFRWRTVTKGTEMYWHGRVADSSEMEIFVASQLNHTPMDSVYMREDTDAEELKRYKVLIYPHAEILTEKACHVLEEYVRQGGCLIIGARTGQKDVNGHCVMKQMPGLLSPLTQSVVKEFTLIGPDDGAVTMNWNGKEVETGILEPFTKYVHAPQECELAIRRKKDKEYLFILNFSKESQKIVLQCEMTDMDSGERVKGDINLAPYETKVYRDMFFHV